MYETWSDAHIIPVTVFMFASLLGIPYGSKSPSIAAIAQSPTRILYAALRLIFLEAWSMYLSRTVSMQ